MTGKVGDVAAAREGYLRLLQRLNDACATDAAFKHSVLVLYLDGSKLLEPIGC
jgi:putative hemolysin